MIGNNFFICQNATLPVLRLELIYDGRYDFWKSSNFNAEIQNAEVTFSMWDEHDVLKICDAPCNIVLINKDTCDERYIIEYRWKERDTKRKGHFKGKVKIVFNEDLYEKDVEHIGGILINPIYEDLDIFVK